MHPHTGMQPVERLAETENRWVIDGIVRTGARRGRVLGFPTANLEPCDAPQFERGVYGGWAGIDGEPMVRPAMIYVGSAPTFGLGAPRIEAHLFDYSGNLYGRRLRLLVGARVAGECRYASATLLAASLADLAVATRRLLGCARGGDT